MAYAISLPFEIVHEPILVYPSVIVGLFPDPFRSLFKYSAYGGLGHYRAFWAGGIDYDRVHIMASEDATAELICFSPLSMQSTYSGLIDNIAFIGISQD